MGADALLTLQFLNTILYYEALLHEVQAALAEAPAPSSPGSRYAYWHEHVRGPALRGYVPRDEPVCGCGRPGRALYVGRDRREDDTYPRVCGACYVERWGGSPTAPWRGMLERVAG